MAVEVFRLMLTTSLLMTAPMLLTGMAVGVLISLIQAVTSIQEQTLSFVPKLVAVAFVLMFMAYQLIEQIVDFTNDIFQRMTTLAG